MKRIGVILFSLAVTLALVLLGGAVHAEEGSGIAKSVMIREESGGYRLYEYSGGVIGAELYSADTVSELLIPLSLGGYEVRFDGVTCYENVTVPDTDLTFTGALTVFGSVTVGEGARLTLRDIDLTISSGGISVKGGALSFLSGNIYSDSTAITLMGMAKSTLLVDGGVIITSSSAPSVSIRQGTADLTGGRVENSSGVALENNSTLNLGSGISLSGAPYEIITSLPIYLSSAGTAFSSGARVQYTAEFDKGRLTPVFYKSSPSAEYGVKLYDKNGTEERITFFESHALFDENNFSAVYKPFAVEFRIDGESVSTSHFLLDEALALPTFDKKVGYTLSGWFYDEDMSESAAAGSVVKSDMTLYAKNMLDRPTFTIKSAVFTYDKSEHLLDFSSLEHPLSDKGFYTYEWINSEGETVAYTRALPLLDVKDSGEYKCKVTFTVGRDTATFTTPLVSAVVNKCAVSIPRCESAVYNGRVQYSLLSSTSVYTAGEACGTDAGLYPVELTLVDPDNYAWESSESAVCFTYFEISKAENTFTEALTVSDLYFGSAPAPVAISRFGSVRYLYATDPLGVFSADVPTGIGAYYVKAAVDETENYYALESAPMLFKIKSEELLSLSILTMPNKCVYTAFDYFIADGLTVKALYTSGREGVLSAAEVSVFYQTSDRLRYGDSGVVIEYLGYRLTLPLTVNKKEYDYTLIFNNSESEYSGLYQTLSYDFSCATPLDSFPLSVTLSGGGTDVGTYGVTLSFSSESADYIIPQPITRTLTVSEKEVTVVWGESDFVYNGYIQAPTAYFTDVFGAKRTLSVTGGRSGAGIGCIATAVTGDKNYKLLGETKEFSIIKADFDLSGLCWNTQTFIYNSEEQTVTLSGLPEGLSVLGYVGNTATEVGNYTAEVLFGYDSDNYNEPSFPSFPWEISPAEYDMSGVRFSSVEVFYDGEVHYPDVTGDMPIGLDGSRLTYSFSEGVTDAGEKIIKITFYTDSKNYVVPEEQYVSVRVLAKGVYVAWGNTEFTYNGYLQLPEAVSSECPIAIYALGVNAGTHTARAVSLSENFYIINGEIEYNIAKAENFWTTSPSASDIFLGSSLSAEAEAHFGIPEYKIYSDSELKNEVDSLDLSGTYYLVATVAQSENYLALTSRPISFKVIDIVPVSIDVVIGDRKFFAFDTLSPSDFVCTVTNNDGSVFIHPDVEVIYGAGRCLSAADSTVTFSCFGLNCTEEITVFKLDYDMSGVAWESAEHIYDGSEKQAYLTGLPEGVEVLEYTLSGAVGAGEYPLSALLSYDSVNYNAPILPEAYMTVLKQTVTPATLYGEQYNGRAQQPVSNSELYTLLTDGEYINAGSYEVRVVLVDSDNYVLTKDTAEFIILKREITVTVNPLTLYMFEEIGEINGEVTSGSILSADGNIIVYRQDGDILTAEVTNPNYNLTVIEGRIERIDKPSKDGLSLIFTLSLLLLLIILAAVAFAVRYKRKLAAVSTGGALALLPEPKTIFAPLSDEQQTSAAVTLERAETMITDAIAKTLIRKRDMSVVTSGRKKGIINLDTVSENFTSEERVDINSLKEKGLIGKEVYYIKVLGRGSIDKPLKIYANAFSLGAVKMLALSGGEANKVHSAHTQR